MKRAATPAFRYLGRPPWPPHDKGVIESMPEPLLRAQTALRDQAPR